MLSFATAGAGAIRTVGASSSASSGWLDAAGTPSFATAGAGAIRTVGASSFADAGTAEGISEELDGTDSKEPGTLGVWANGEPHLPQ